SPPESPHEGVEYNYAGKSANSRGRTCTGKTSSRMGCKQRARRISVTSVIRFFWPQRTRRHYWLEKKSSHAEKKLTTVRGNQGLAQAEAAIAARHFGVGENLQTFGFESALQVFNQKNILEGAAAQTNIIEAGPPVDEFCCPCQHIHKPLMEAPADHARRHRAFQVVHGGHKQRKSIDYPAAAVGSNLKWVAGVITLARDGRFEFDGRLGLVIDPFPNSRQRRHGIKQAAAA